jgi:hypothetical protein
MAIHQAPEPPRAQHSHTRGYGSVNGSRRTSRTEPPNPASPFKSPLKRTNGLPSDADRASGSSPPGHASSSSQLSSPPSLGPEELPKLGSPGRSRTEVEEDMDMEEIQQDDNEEEEEEDTRCSVIDFETDSESAIDDRVIVHSELTGSQKTP